MTFNAIEFVPAKTSSVPDTLIVKLAWTTEIKPAIISLHDHPGIQLLPVLIQPLGSNRLGQAHRVSPLSVINTLTKALDPGHLGRLIIGRHSVTVLLGLSMIRI